MNWLFALSMFITMTFSQIAGAACSRSIKIALENISEMKRVEFEAKKEAIKLHRNLNESIVNEIESLKLQIETSNLKLQKLCEESHSSYFFNNSESDMAIELSSLATMLLHLQNAIGRLQIDYLRSYIYRK